MPITVSVTCDACLTQLHQKSFRIPNPSYTMFVDDEFFLKRTRNVRMLPRAYRDAAPNPALRKRFFETHPMRADDFV